MSGNPIRIGIDLGGTKTEVIALSDDGRELFRRRVPTPRDDYEATLEMLAALVAAAEDAAKERGTVGLGIPGAISPATGLVKNANSTWLIGHALDLDLQARLGRPLRIENDANCFALSEAVDGAGRDAEVVFGVIVGTGTGGGVAVGGRVLRGRNAVAGEWGHNPLPWASGEESPGPDCYCGKRGCVETFLSGPGMARDHEGRAGERLDPREIAARAAAGDAAAAETMRRYEGRMARALAAVINVLDPDVIVLGGGMSNLESLYEEVPRLWTGWTFSDRVDTALRRAAHGDSSGVRGAAWLGGAAT